MKNNGWYFVGIGVSKRGHDNRCKTDTWYGYTDPGDGSLQILLKGSGHAFLNFGNCHTHTTGKVKVFLNEEELEVARFGETKAVSFPFSNGYILKITETNAIIKLNSLELKCPGKDYDIIK